MKLGKVSETVLKRSILKPLKYDREESVFPPTAEEMCYGVRLQSGQHVLSSDAALYGNEKDLIVFGLAQVANQLASRGAKVIGASVHILLPPYAYESRLKAMMEYAEAAGSKRGIQILSAKAEVSPAVQSAIVHVHGIGAYDEKVLLRTNMAKENQDIVLLGYIGLEGTFRVMREKEEFLSQRFVAEFLRPLHQMEDLLFADHALEMARDYEVSAMHPIGAGGILAALWELGEAAKIGMDVDLKKMSIRQETVEICEFCHLNPYQLASTGAVLIVTEQGEELVEHFARKGVQASLLGKTTKDTARVIWNGEEKRFLDRPAPDELVKIFE